MHLALSDFRKAPYFLAELFVWPFVRHKYRCVSDFATKNHADVMCGCACCSNEMGHSRIQHSLCSCMTCVQIRTFPKFSFSMCVGGGGVLQNISESSPFPKVLLGGGGVTLEHFQKFSRGGVSLEHF